MKNRNKYIQKNKGTNVIDTILDTVRELIPSLKDVIPANSKAVKEKITSSAFDYANKQIKDVTVKPFTQEKFKKPDSVTNILYENSTKTPYFPKKAVPDYIQLNSTPQSYGTISADKDTLAVIRSERKKPLNQVIAQKNPVKNITNKDAKTIIALAGNKTSNKITAKQIENTFSPSTIVSLIATSKNVSELKNKIDAGIIVRDIQKKHLVGMPNKNSERT
jgi:hypothetical protein